MRGKFMFMFCLRKFVWKQHLRRSCQEICYLYTRAALDAISFQDSHCQEMQIFSYECMCLP